ncbi:MAG: glutamate--tRNA ligase [Patescibacteria group bacterium]
MTPDKIQKFKQVRVRIAPSPTGFLHIGTARAALFNYLFAKKNNGSFIVRIEDTDIERSKPEFEQNILDGLKWLGIDWDEGPDKGGECKFYRQSERLDIYSKYLQKLLDNKQAYYCFCSKEELEVQRQYQMSIGQPPRYDGKCSDLSKGQVEKNIRQGKECVIRFRVHNKKVKFTDLIRGVIEMDTSLIGDMVIAKDLKTPLYNFAVVIDDYEMKISHVIRGEDHISNTPKQILLQEALELPQPQFAHLPLILGTDRSKLSKRHSATSVIQYKKDGYLPEAMINFMAFLGWNPGTDKEIYSLPSLVKDFSIEKIQKSGAIFNIKRLDFLNSFYLRQKSTEKLIELCLPYLIEAGLIEKVGNNPHKPDLATLKLFKNGESPDFKIKETEEIISFDTLKKIVSIYQERLIKLSDIVELTDFFFKDNIEYEKELLRWKEATDEQIKLSIDELIELLSEIEDKDWNKEYLEERLSSAAEEFGKELTGMENRGYLLWPLRVAMTGKKSSAGPFDISEILGKEKTLKRIKEAEQLL